MTGSAISTPDTLAPEQLRQYHQDGYLVIDGLLDPDEVEELRKAADTPQVKQPLKEAGGDQTIVHLLEITAKHPAFRALALDQRIVRLVAQLLGPDLQLQHSKLATKPPRKGAGEFAWHQDFAFFPHTNANLLAVMVMLDDATPENGCMSIVRGSHKRGLLNHLVDGYFTAACQEPEHWSRPADIVPLTPKAGGISIHHCLMLHASPNNLSGRPRRGVVYEYRAGDAYQLAGTIFADTGLQIAGTNRGVARCDAGLLQLPRRRPQAGDPDTTPFGSAYNQSGSHARTDN
jgi:ectoine hydroxylase-related dioxygenase (phytanoyl-CoA dioxygenase family)